MDVYGQISSYHDVDSAVAKAHRARAEAVRNGFSWLGKRLTGKR